MQEQVDQILLEAENAGLRENFLFKTTFQRYLKLMNYLRQLEMAIEKEGVCVEKQYVKGRPNIYTNPALTSYNTTVASANATVKTLVHIVDAFKGESGSDSKLQAFLNSLNDE